MTEINNKKLNKIILKWIEINEIANYTLFFQILNKFVKKGYTIKLILDNLEYSNNMFSLQLDNLNNKYLLTKLDNLPLMWKKSLKYFDDIILDTTINWIEDEKYKNKCDSLLIDFVFNDIKLYISSFQYMYLNRKN